MLGRGDLWRPIESALPDTELSGPDLLGHGSSPDWNGLGSFSDAALDLALSRLKNPVDLLGHSYGAYLALRVALTRPDLVRSLCLIEPVFFAAAPTLLESHRAEFAPIVDEINSGQHTIGASQFIDKWGGTPFDLLPDASKKYCRDRIHLVAATGQDLVDDKAQILPRLAEISCPVHLILGEKTPEIINDVARGLASGLRARPRQSIILGAGHMVPLTHPIETADAIGTGWLKVS